MLPNAGAYIFVAWLGCLVFWIIGSAALLDRVGNYESKRVMYTLEALWTLLLLAIALAVTTFQLGLWH